MRNAQQYIESLRDGREVYIHGERVEDITRHPSLRKAIDHGALDYELDKRPELRDLLVTRSPGTGNEIRRYFEMPRSAEDLLRRQELIETTTRADASWVVFMKEIGTDALNALNMICYDIDKKYGTDYSSTGGQVPAVPGRERSQHGRGRHRREGRPALEALRTGDAVLLPEGRGAAARRGRGEGLQGAHHLLTDRERALRPPHKGDGGERQGLLHCLRYTRKYARA